MADLQAAQAERRATMQALAERFEGSVQRVVDSVSTTAAQVHATAADLVTNAAATDREAGSVKEASQQTAAQVQTIQPGQSYSVTVRPGQESEVFDAFTPFYHGISF